MALENLDVFTLPIAPFNHRSIGIYFFKCALDDELPIDAFNLCVYVEGDGVLDGLHDVGAVNQHLGRDTARFRQVPPKGFSSITAPERPAFDTSADTSRPEPEPITIRSNVRIKSSSRLAVKPISQRLWAGG